MIRKTLTAAAVLMGLALPASAQSLAKDVFGAFRTASGGPAVSIGNYSQGCAQGLVQMPESGPSWQSMRLSRNRNWGHPEMIGFLQGLSRAAQQAGWRGLYIGDISQPRGGPMTSGHASHQLGLDADIWMLPPPTLGLSPQQRENLSSVSVVANGGTALSGNWTGGHMSIMRAAARDPRVERIFVDPVAKVAMCQMETGNRDWLRKIRPINNHDFHFHVRMNCPAGSICQTPNPIPAGDGCAEAQEWINIRIDPSRAKPSTPDPNYRHPRTYRMSDLPAQCSTVASAP
ncbi:MULTISPECIES: penicillin-insensitive murein endopeptidase [Paracoccus]|uniref:Penicillin-insensitive murein endopeptidase n=1 Tax=Paracoccus haeundaensis TaxID=225362 RepID=A0A5C4R237_9RHOB|nr:MULTISPECIES: penicillin-insensitive murein endopeptidase [Paracoccus]TYP68997.1 penicillin-insensitive murein endopeptidase [Stutzerimonas stutzeri]AZY92397.1 penicillin-insensitive murein endopeptidase [Paracoccus sp. Arc7-R13]KJZ30741.1 peptidase [Paracoccus sp. S4493]TNB95532.1 penicillin-insensitive murein endopeptidase [Paracoccus marcusii]TNH38020.1 penicillin-insensitive murein endopeptidase [Paracoccus haeundaensis]